MTAGHLSRCSRQKHLWVAGGSLKVFIPHLPVLIPVHSSVYHFLASCHGVCVKGATPCLSCWAHLALSQPNPSSCLPFLCLIIASSFTPFQSLTDRSSLFRVRHCLPGPAVLFPGGGVVHPRPCPHLQPADLQLGPLHPTASVFSAIAILFGVLKSVNVLPVCV